MEILIAEDDLVSRRLLKRTLETWGHTVLLAENGQQAWDIFQKENVRFVVADWIMPVVDGVTLCTRIRSTETSGYVYFILLTGKDKKEDIVKGLAAGADDYLTKPFDREELRVRVRAGERILNLEKELKEKNEKLKGLNEKLEELIRIDPLMDIGNRRSFHEVMEKMHSRALRYKQKYGIVMCDIDNFKSYNDNYGHLSGDIILKKVAVAIKNSLRGSDEVFRYGGEEIVVIVPNQNLDTTFNVAERLRKAVESLEIEHDGVETGIITISCGASAFNPKFEDSKWTNVLDCADQALLQAKSSGKNRVKSNMEICKTGS